MIVWIVEEHFSKVFKNIFEKCDKKGEMDKPGLSLQCTTVEHMCTGVPFTTVKFYEIYSLYKTKFYL